MNRRSSPRATRHLMPVFALLALLAQPAGADGARLQIAPHIVQIDGPETEIEVTLDGASGLYGLDIRLEYDPSLIEVVDADPTKDGVQVTAGQIPTADFVVRNEADNAAGTIWYAVTQLNPREPASGSGVVCVLRLRGLADGSGEVRVVGAILVDRAGQDLSVETSGAQVTVALGAAPASEDAASATPTTTHTPTEQPTLTPDPTAVPTSTPESQVAEPTETDEPTPTEEPAAEPEPEDPDPTPTGESTATPTTGLAPAATPMVTGAPLPQPAHTDRDAYPPLMDTPLAAAAGPAPRVVAATAPVAPAPAEAPDPTSTATDPPAAAVEPMPPAASQSLGGDGSRAPGPDGRDVGPLISPPLFAALLGLVAASALALTVYLARYDAQATRHPADRSTR